RLRPAGARALAGEVGPPAGDGGPWRWSQAVMELGGRVGARRRPRCAGCPVRAWCGWLAAGLTPPDPADGSAGVSARQPAFEGSVSPVLGRYDGSMFHG